MNLDWKYTADETPTWQNLNGRRILVAHELENDEEGGDWHIQDFYATGYTPRQINMFTRWAYFLPPTP